MQRQVVQNQISAIIVPNFFSENHQVAYIPVADRVTINTNNAAKYFPSIMDVKVTGDVKEAGLLPFFLLGRSHCQDREYDY